MSKIIYKRKWETERPTRTPHLPCIRAHKGSSMLFTTSFQMPGSFLASWIPEKFPIRLPVFSTRSILLIGSAGGISSLGSWNVNHFKKILIISCAVTTNSLYVCVCTYAYISICTRTNPVYISKYMMIRTCMCVHTQICVYICIHIYTCIHIHVYIYMYIYLYIHIYIYYAYYL